MDPKIDNALIKKETLYCGDKFIPLKLGSRVRFHYQTRKCDENKTLIDDSRKTEKPMELVLGKQFKLEVWEVIVQKMSLNEVAKFTVDKSLVSHYPFVSKTIRDSQKSSHERKHCCGMTLQNEGLGYKELDELFKNPSDLEFTIELLSVEMPEDYEKDSWQLNDDEKVKTVDELRERGNEQYKFKNYSEAMKSYELALGMLEQLMLKEKPQDVEWMELFEKKKPLLLNYSQCKLNAKDYYPAIQYCSEVLKYDPSNVKAYFRRAKANVGAWNLQDAKDDFAKAQENDPSLFPVVTKELAHVEAIEKNRDEDDKKKFKNMFK